MVGTAATFTGSVRAIALAKPTARPAAVGQHPVGPGLTRPLPRALGVLERHVLGQIREHPDRSVAQRRRHSIRAVAESVERHDQHPLGTERHELVSHPGLRARTQDDAGGALDDEGTRHTELQSGLSRIGSRVAVLAKPRCT